MLLETHVYGSTCFWKYTFIEKHIYENTFLWNYFFFGVRVAGGGDTGLWKYSLCLLASSLY